MLCLTGSSLDTNSITLFVLQSSPLLPMYENQALAEYFALSLSLALVALFGNSDGVQFVTKFSCQL